MIPANGDGIFLYGGP